jgi:hypothetical protein
MAAPPTGAGDARRTKGYGAPTTRWACAIPGIILLAAAALSRPAAAQTLANDKFKVAIGASGEISSLQISGDAFPTNYVLNAANAPGQNTADHEWLGELMFTYRLGGGAWTTARTNQSNDARAIAAGSNSVTGNVPRVGQHDGDPGLQARRDLRARQRLPLLADHRHQHELADARDRRLRFAAAVQRAVVDA